MPADSKQAQRIVFGGGKMEQVQTMRVYEPADFDGYCRSVYAICKGNGQPVLPAVTRKIVEIAHEDCGSYRKAGAALGVSHEQVRRTLASENGIVLRGVMVDDG